MSIEHLHEVFMSSTGVCTDTRKIIKDSVFFALKGGNFNGNKYVNLALEGGCSFAVVDEPVEVVDDSRIMQVKDVLDCLQQLANFHRSKLKGKVIALTGSNGKTTSKELMAAVLAKKKVINATIGNLNNHIGVPLTILNTPLSTDLLIVEMGANHQGEIMELCKITDPDYGMVINIGKAHLEGFGGVEGVKKGKTEMYKFMNAKGGKLFFNNNEPSIQEFKGAVKNKIEYGTGTSVEVLEIKEQGSKLSFEIQIDGELIQVGTNLFGNYNVNNVLTAIAIGRYFGVSSQDAVNAVEDYAPDNNRSQEKTTAKHNKVVFDAYNANPTSMWNAVQEFAKSATAESCFILGDMKELGEDSKEEHQRLLNELKHLPGKKYLVGSEFFKEKDNFSWNFFKTSDELLEELRKVDLSNTNILIKGSRGVALEKIEEVL